MVMNVTDNFFIQAKPVWAKGLENGKKYNLGAL